MQKVNYIVVGCGLAGIAFCEQLRKKNESFVVFDDASQQSSLVAAGMYNPVILKRFSEVWMAKEQLKLAKPFYKKLEALLKVKLDYEFKLLRRFASVEEQNMWFTALDKPKIEPFLSSTLINNIHTTINAPFGFGEVLHAGRVDTNTLIKDYLAFLDKNNLLQKARFEYNKLKIYDDDIEYDAIRASKIVFCEGFGIKHNPFFNQLPLKAVKGEVLTIESPDLNIDFALKSSIFIIPEGNSLYSVGATYNWEDLTNNTSESARIELTTKLKKILTCDFKVVSHVAGVRPTVKDRRPLVGSHQVNKNVFVLNGLGTRGVMIAPYIAGQLYNFIEEKAALNPEININRFSC